jgi:hypothetical protein
MGEARVRGPLMPLAPSVENAPASAPEAPTANVLRIQGRVTDASGIPLNGSHTIVASLYDLAGGGVARCTDSDSVTVTNGLFNMDFDFCTIGNIDGDQLYLGIKVDGDPEMTPRQTIRPVPYAYNLRPDRVATGPAKAGVMAFCGSALSTIIRSFSNLGTTITIANGASAGRCTIDFGFKVDDRYMVAMANSTNVRIVTFGDNASANKLDFLHADDAGTGISGNIMVLVY